MYLIAALFILLLGVDLVIHIYRYNDGKCRKCGNTYQYIWYGADNMHYSCCGHSFRQSMFWEMILHRLGFG